MDIIWKMKFSRFLAKSGIRFLERNGSGLKKNMKCCGEVIWVAILLIIKWRMRMKTTTKTTHIFGNHFCFVTIVYFFKLYVYQKWKFEEFWLLNLLIHPLLKRT